jgi:Bacterial protein of unknown function (DUF899)
MGMSFPNETTTYRAARDALLASEMALRRQMEAVAAELRALPPGGEVPEDYTFEAIGPDSTPVVMRMSELFRGGDTLMVYHYMFPRHSRDERLGPTRGTFAHRPLEEGPCSSTCGRALCRISKVLAVIWSSWRGHPSNSWSRLHERRVGNTQDWFQLPTTASGATMAVTALTASRSRS